MSNARLSTDDLIEARSSIQTANGPLDVVARNRGDRWTVRASCTGREGAGIRADLGGALMAALELCGVDTGDLER